MASRGRRPVVASGLGHGITALFLLISSLLLTPRCALAQPPSSSNAGGGNNSNNGNYFGAAKFNPSMAIAVVVLVTAFFFLGFLSIYLRNCGRATDEGSPRLLFAGAAAAPSRRSQRLTGLGSDVLETFPTMDYSEVKEHKVGKGALECAVCISEFEDDETLRLLPACNHIFHADCIDAWLASHVTCPVCRFDLSDAVDNPVALDAVEAGSPRPTSAEVLIGVPSTGTNAAPHAERVMIVVEPIAETGEEKEEEEQHRREEAMELAELRSRKRALRSRSGRRPSKFPRSHSTGHSLAKTAEECDDRYTLRLPEHILMEIIATKKLHRSASRIAFPTAEDESSRRGYRSSGAGEGSSRGGRSARGLGKSDRWPSLFMHTLSAKFPSWRRGGGRRGFGEEGLT